MVRVLTEDEKIMQEVEVTCNNLIYYLRKSFIITSPYGSRTQPFWYLNIVSDSPTRVEINSYWGKYEFNIYVNTDMVANYAEKYSIDVGSAAKLLVAHEILHIVLGHFNKKYKDHNKKILNIAGDLEINQLIGLKAPALQVEDFGFRPYHTTDYYYDKLIEEFNTEDEEVPSENNTSSSDNENNSNSESNNSENYENEISEEEEENYSSNMNSADSNLEDEDDIDENEEFGNNNYNSNGCNPYDSDPTLDDILEDKLINESTEENLGQEDIDISFTNKDKAKLEKIIQKEIENIDYTLDGLAEIIRKIERVEKSVKIMPHSRVSTYHKFNNRRKSEFILPGKRFDNSGITRKFNSSPVVFIDVSYSTQGIINRDLNAVAKKLHEIGATIVYYESRIVNICEPSSMFFSQRVCGGTNITCTIEEYIQEFGEFNRAYVFTDGLDRFDKLNEVCKKFNVYFIKNSKVKEIFNEKTYRPNKYYGGSW